MGERERERDKESLSISLCSVYSIPPPPEKKWEYEREKKANRVDKAEERRDRSIKRKYAITCEPLTWNVCDEREYEMMPASHGALPLPTHSPQLPLTRTQHKRVYTNAHTSFRLIVFVFRFMSKLLERDRPRFSLDCAEKSSGFRAPTHEHMLLPKFM